MMEPGTPTYPGGFARSAREGDQHPRALVAVAALGAVRCSEPEAPHTARPSKGADQITSPSGTVEVYSAGA